MLWETVSVVRDLHRLHEVASVLIRYGWGDIVRLLGIANAVERTGRLLHWKSSSEITHLPAPVRIRRALEELGPTYIKFGQLLATRVDMFPPSWIEEFEKLHNNVPPVAYEEVRPTLLSALKGEPEEVFSSFDRTPMAAASIAQVYRAVHKDGTPVVVKVRRPNIEIKVEADLRILDHFAHLLESEVPDMRRYQPVQIAAQFRRSLRRELDLVKEARNIDQFARNFSDNPLVQIPKVYWDYCTDHVNVQEEILGVSGVDEVTLRSHGLDPPTLAANGADVVLKMIMVDGYFHADPHPGNVIFLPGNRIGLIDFGMVGRVTEVRRNQLVNLLHALTQKDEQAMLEVLLDWSGDSETNESKLSSDISELVYSYDDLRLKDVKLGNLLQDISSMLRENHLVLPADLTLLFKTLITLEGLGMQLNPAFHMLDHVSPFVEKVFLERYLPATLVKRGRKSLRELGEVMVGLPRDFARLIREARRGRIRIDLDLKRLDHFGQQLDRSSNRLTMGILTASLVIGSSIILTVKGGPELFGLPLFGLLGFLAAFINSVWIILSIWRSGKH
jgi:ubiquinone biosynthesis protein